VAEQLTINGLNLLRPGFARVTDLTPLMAKGRMRGDDWTSQGVAGVTFRPKVRDALVVLLQVVVESDKTSTGTNHAVKGMVGLEANMAAIDAACVAGSMSSLVTLTLTRSNASTRTGQVYCPSFEPGEYVDDALAVQLGVLEVVIPSGALS
jgi:hypothetical protein